MSPAKVPGLRLLARLILLIPAWMVAGCAWTPRAMSYPSGLRIVLGDRHTLDSICDHVDDKGKQFERNDYAAGCYDSENDTIYLLDSCTGAKALPHELGHREGIADPEAAGMNW